MIFQFVAPLLVFAISTTNTLAALALTSLVADLPYELNYLWNSLKYVHKPSDPYNISSVDGLKVKFFDGALWSEEHAVGIDIVKFNEVPMLKAENLTTLVVEEEVRVGKRGRSRSRDRKFTRANLPMKFATIILTYSRLVARRVR